MKTSLSKSRIYFIALIFLSATSCIKPNSPKVPCGACPLLQALPGINAKIVDKTTGEDLFFGSQAPYKISQLKVRHLVNGQQDSAYLFVDTTAHHIFIGAYPVHGTDTLTLQIADLSQDNLIFKTSVTGPCCPQLVLNSVLFDGNLVYNAANGPSVVILAK